MTASWPWLVCLKRANAASARYQENLSTRGPKSAGPVSGGPPIDCRASYPNARSAGGLVSLRIFDRREADLSEQGGPLTAKLAIVRRPLDHLGDGGQRIVPEPGLGVDERKTLPTRLGDERPQPFGPIDALDRTAGQDVSRPASRVRHDRDEPSVLDAGSQAHAEIHKADAVHAAGDGRRKTLLDERFRGTWIADGQLHRERGRTGDEPVERRLLLDREPAVIGRQRGQHEDIPRRPAGAASYPAARRSTQRRLVDRHFTVPGLGGDSARGGAGVVLGGFWAPTVAGKARTSPARKIDTARSIAFIDVPRWRR